MSHHSHQKTSDAPPAGGPATGHYPGQGPASAMGPTAPYWTHPPVYQQAAYPASRPTSVLSRDRFLKGLLIGAAATYLLTNEQVQRTAIKGVVQAWSLLQGGMEEIKERFGDAEAELRHASQRQDP